MTEADTDQFRTVAHDLEIERGRYNDIPREVQLCKVCSSHEIEDGYYFIFRCKLYFDLRILILHSRKIPYKSNKTLVALTIIK